ncbi:MAG: hypothetical protein F6K21_10835 [Symploca sp. SIO2D2]|nr:hypothetical protein [Symploca sp. SIO2D2]
MSSFSNIRHQIRQLTFAEQLRLLEDLVIVVCQQAKAQPQRSILELKGLGKEVWQGIDAQAYVDQERESWNG